MTGKEGKDSHDNEIRKAMSFRKIFGFSKREGIYIIAYSIIIVILTGVIHESGHILGALAVGIPLNGIKIGISWNPEVILPSITHGHFSNASLEVYYYAGGFFAAAFLLCGYFLITYRKYRTQPSWFVWFLGLVTAILGVEQIGNAIFEGRWHAAYVSYVDSSSPILETWLICFVLIGFCVHFLFFELSKLKEKGDQ